MTDTPKWYDGHLKEFQKTAHIKSKEEFDEMYRRSIEDVDNFWGEAAREYLTWDKEWDSVLKWSSVMKSPSNGSTAACSMPLTTAWTGTSISSTTGWPTSVKGTNPSDSHAVTYLALYKEVNKFAAVLEKQGVKKGDRVIIYMPMIIELPVAMLACARIGAIHCVIYGGFSSQSIITRIHDCKAEIVITVDGGYRGGKLIPYKGIVDEALAQCPGVTKCIL